MIKTGFRKALALVTLLSVFGLMIVGCSSPGGDAGEDAVKLGETVTVEKITYTVNDVSEAKKVGGEGNTNTAQDDTYLIVDLKIENIGEERSEFDGDMAKLWDIDDQAYDLDLEATAAACSASGIADVVNIWFGGLDPGQTIQTKAVFDIPKDLKELKLEVRSPIIGSDERAFILLSEDTGEEEGGGGEH